MAKKDEISKCYELPAKLDACAFVLFWANAIFSLVAAMIAAPFQSAAFIAQSIVAISFVVIDCVNDMSAWYDAERARRRHLVENAFNINLTGKFSVGYYNNHTDVGLSRAIVNAFESVFFSLNVINKMLIGIAIKAVIAVAAFLLIAMSVQNSAIYPIATQVTFSSYYVIHAARAVVFRNRLQALYESFYRELITVGVSKRNQIIALVADVEEYESIKAHYKVRLSSRVFNKMNDDLTKQWEDISAHVVINALEA